VIFGAIGLLAVALVLLVVGIAKSLVAPLVFSVLATCAALGLLYASFLYYRKQASGSDDVAVEPGYPGAYTPPHGTPAVPLLAPPAVATAAPSNGSSSVVERWSSLKPAAAERLVAGLDLDELHDVRRLEVELRGHTSVLEAIDARIESVAALRREVSGRR
jgi:hypothetical protein